MATCTRRIVPRVVLFWQWLGGIWLTPCPGPLLFFDPWVENKTELVEKPLNPHIRKNTSVGISIVMEVPRKLNGL